MHFVIREKLKGHNMPVSKSKAALIMDLAHEMKELKEEFENKAHGKNSYFIIS